MQLVVVVFFFAAVFDIDGCGIDALGLKFGPLPAELELF